MLSPQLIVIVPIVVDTENPVIVLPAGGVAKVQTVPDKAVDHTRTSLSQASLAGLPWNAIIDVFWKENI